MLLCVCISGSSFRFNATTSAVWTHSPSLCWIVFHSLQKDPHITHTNTHMCTSQPFFQEYCSFSSWFCRHSSCLRGLLEEPDRQGTQRDRKLWTNQTVVLINLHYFFHLLSNSTFVLTLHGDCTDGGQFKAITD